MRYYLDSAQVGTAVAEPAGQQILAGVAVIAGGLVEADPAAVARTADSISERNRRAEARHRCPKCHADHFTQHVSRGEPPY
jgi:hypothetical protein